MAERLATWVWVGATALACVAGMVNVIGYPGFQHQAITHLTGNTSFLGAALGAGDRHSSMPLFGAIGAFVAGAALNGLIIQADALQLGRRYGLVPTIESLLRIVAVPLFQRQNPSGPLIAAVALAGSLLFSASGYQSLYLPAAITGTGGIAYLVYTQRWRAVRFPGK